MTLQRRCEEEHQGCGLVAGLYVVGHNYRRFPQPSKVSTACYGTEQPPFTPFFISLTLFDQLKYLQLEYDNLVKHASKPFPVQVSVKYFGTENVSRTKPFFLASVVVRFQPESLHTMGKIMNSENPPLCLNNSIIDSGNATNTKQVMETVDCHDFRMFITLHSIRGLHCSWIPTMICKIAH